VKEELTAPFGHGSGSALPLPAPTQATHRAATRGSGNGMPKACRIASLKRHNARAAHHESRTRCRSGRDRVHCAAPRKSLLSRASGFARLNGKGHSLLRDRRCLTASSGHGSEGDAVSSRSIQPSDNPMSQGARR